MSEPLYVDPERLARQGRPYEDASRNWYRLQERIAGIRARYAGAWGDDDMGNQFGPSFDEGMDAVELRAKGVGETLSYYGEGLVESGRIYADAREDAESTSHSFLQDTNYIGGHEAPNTTNPYLDSSYAVTEGQVTQPLLRRQAVARLAIPAEENAYAPGENTEGEVTEPLPEGYVRAQHVRGRLLTPGEEPLEPLQGYRTPALRAEEGMLPLEPLQGRRLPTIPAEEVIHPLEPTYTEAEARAFTSFGPSTEGETTEPLRPVYKSVRPGEPALEGELPLQPVYRSVRPGEGELPEFPAYTAQPALPGIPADELEPLQPAFLTQPVVVRSEKPESE